MDGRISLLVHCFGVRGLKSRESIAVNLVFGENVKLNAGNLGDVLTFNSCEIDDLFRTQLP